VMGGRQVAPDRVTSLTSPSDRVATYDNLRGTLTTKEPSMRTGLALLLVVWLVIGALAGLQRHYYSGSYASCAKAGTIAVTVLAGPLNYAGVNPKVAHCSVPQPSK